MDGGNAATKSSAQRDVYLNINAARNP